MKILEDKLEALDAYFAPKKESEKWVMILGVAGMIAYMAYAYLLPFTENMYKKSKTAKTSIQKSIIANKTYLNSITVSGDRSYYIKKFDRDITNKKASIVRINNNIKFINKNLEKLSDMLYDRKSWSKFLNSITNKAEIQNIDIKYIQNKSIDANGSFGHVLEIVVGCYGSYRNLVKFMNEIEQNTLVTDIYGTEFISDQNSSKISADIKISVWGINH